MPPSSPPPASQTAPVNDAPTSGGTTLNGTEDGEATLDLELLRLAAKDVDDELSALQVSLDRQTSTRGAALSINAQGGITYKPPADVNGVDTFTYILTDSKGASVSVTATVNIGGYAACRLQPFGAAHACRQCTHRCRCSSGHSSARTHARLPSWYPLRELNHNACPLPRTPAPVNDFVQLLVDPFYKGATEDTPFKQAAAGGVVAAASDVDGNHTLMAVAGAFSTSKEGTVDIAADGGFTYTPADDFAGDDTFKFTVTDGEYNVTGKATVTVGKCRTLARC